MTFQYDAVIIGAGPAGAACALTLQKRGANCCLIDKAVFPRHKTCAGLVTAKTMQLIRSLYPEDKVESLFCDSTSQIKLYRKTEELVKADLKKPVHLVDRTHFDNALVEEYKRIGGVMREGERGYQINYADNCITLSNGDVLSYDYLIFADGALSNAHKQLNIDRRKLAFGIETYVPADLMKVNSVDLYFDYLKTGYVWAFPHGDTVCVGAADQYNPKTDYKKLFSSILTDFGIRQVKLKYHGAFLPYGYVIPQDDLPDNTMLIGDAGGFTDPISGEGLYMAMKTGVTAAESLNTSAPKQTYLNAVQPLVSIIKEGTKARDTFYSPLVHKLFFRKVKGNKKAVAFFFENMVEDYRYDYSGMPQLLRDYKNNRK